MVEGGSTAIYGITAVGIVVMILAFIAWVWFENAKLTRQAAKLRAAAGPSAATGPPEFTAR